MAVRLVGSPGPHWADVNWNNAPIYQRSDFFVKKLWPQWVKGVGEGCSLDDRDEKSGLPYDLIATLFSESFCEMCGEGDYYNAARLSLPIAQKGYAPAQYGLGCLLRDGKGVEQDDVEAAEYFQRAAEQGHLKAQYELGCCYRDYRGVERDHAKAVNCFRRALGKTGYHNPMDDRAPYALGCCYRDGTGVKKDFGEAEKLFAQFMDILFHKVEHQKHPDSEETQYACDVGRFIKYKFSNSDAEFPYSKKAVKYLRLAAEEGNAEAQYELGDCYLSGITGEGKNMIEAARWFRKAAAQGHAQAQYNLGLCYYYGRGLPENRTEAEKWFRKAAEQGDPDAQNKLEVLGRGKCISKQKNAAEPRDDAAPASRNGYITTGAGGAGSDFSITVTSKKL